ncbi:helix-turn-helix domain-containing protein [Nonomuraea sp. NPDC049625]|uniref:helix-turn-helix domain-containing protein n=1 Tax=Nonomuraea sp. NPDC049625 TaxID=3155775 RepID=UPI00343C403F
MRGRAGGVESSGVDADCGGVGEALIEVRPRRVWCSSCTRTHVLLPVTGLLRRADGVEGVGAALEAKAQGMGHRRIAAGLGRPPSTVRGWLRRFAASAGRVRTAFTTVLVRVAGGTQLILPAATETAFADAVAAVVAVSMAVGRRFARSFVVDALSPWLVACAVTGGRLLAPAGRGELINTSALLGAVM